MAMGEEATEGAALGTKLIMFVAIISIALATFLIGKSLVNKGADSLTSAAEQIDNARFSDYDSKTVRGSTVKTCLDNFSNEDIAIVICTLSMAEAEKSGGGIKNIEGYNKENPPTVVEITGLSMQTSTGAILDTAMGFNYNAVFSDGLVANGKLPAKVKLTAKSGSVLYDKSFSIDNAGNSMKYSDTFNMTKKGTGEYIADAASFSSSLVRNSEGEISGVLFIQKKVN